MKQIPEHMFEQVQVTGTIHQGDRATSDAHTKTGRHGERGS